MDAVSNTHLIGIVGYRPLSTLSPAIPYMLMLMLFFSFLKLTPRAVSYTHLDVYKRQVLLCPISMDCISTMTSHAAR